MSHAADAGHPVADRPAGPAAASTPHALPDRRLFWQWVWSAVRPVLGWVLAALGAIALFAGWYGVSGEALTAKQLPYLVSGGLSGIALVVLAAAFLATEDFRRQTSKFSELEAKVDALHRLFAAELAAPPAPTTEPDRPVAVRVGTSAVLALPGGASYHRPDCTLVRGKTDAAPVDAQTVQQRSLRPCRICDPPPLG